MATGFEELEERRSDAAEIALVHHRDALGRHVFMDGDPAEDLSQLLTSLQVYAKRMGINFTAALEGDQERYWDDEVVEVAPVAAA